MKKCLFAVLSLLVFSGCQEEQEILYDFNNGHPVLCQNSIQTPVIINNKSWSYSAEFKTFYIDTRTFRLGQCNSKGEN